MSEKRSRRHPAFWVELVLALVVVGACAVSIGAVYAPLPGESLIVDQEWLKARLDDPNVLVIDARDLLSYRRSHIPGAVNVGDRDVHDFTGPGGRTLKSPAELEAVFRRAGLNQGQTVVVYSDDRSRGMAERLFFVLEYLGASDVRVLQGGFEEWERSGAPVTRDASPVEPGNFTASPRAYMIAGSDRIQSIQRNGDGHIIDVRSFEEYAGSAGSTARLGHIPGAAHLTADKLFSGRTTPKTAHQMRLVLEKVWVHTEHPMVVYGNTPIEAAQVYFGLRLIGAQVVSIYEGSWADWAGNESLPVDSAATTSAPVLGVSTTCW